MPDDSPAASEIAADPHEHLAKPTRQRLLVACGAFLFAAGVTTVSLAPNQPWIQASDFTYPWLAARALLQGNSPYAAVANGDVPWSHWFAYPLPAAILAMPFASLPASVAAAVFSGLSAAMLAFAVTRVAWWPLLMLLSAPALQTYASVQWSFLLVTAAIYTPIAGILIAKPNIGIPLLAFQRHAAALAAFAVGAGALLCASFLLDRSWVSEWLSVVRSPETAARYTPPVGTLLGLPIALAVFRWRRPEARLLLLMSCVPQRLIFYDQMPLFLIPKGRREMLVACLTSNLAYILANRYSQNWLLQGVYWPMLAMVLRRPNTSEQFDGDAEVIAASADRRRR